MRRLWLYFLPLLFLPNLGSSVSTAYGVLELSDWLIFPYIFLVYLGANTRKPAQIDRVVPRMLLFLAWALIVTLLIGVRYQYSDWQVTLVGLYKLGKLFIYVLAGYLTAKALRDDDTRRRFVWSLIACGLVIGFGLAALGQKSAVIATPLTAEGNLRGYKASNAISVLAAMMSCYFAGVWVQFRGPTAFARAVIPITLLVLIYGAAISEGRGGWLAGICGLLYLCYKQRLSTRAAALVIPAIAIVVVGYAVVPVFRHRVDFTLSPNSANQNSVAGVDDGSRLEIWLTSLQRFPSPVFGTGFFHRTDDTGIFRDGSHNFFLQMFLETGIPGGILMLGVFQILWRTAGSPTSVLAGFELPVKSAIVAACVGGMGGEYFYGGVTLLGLVVLFGTAGSLTPLGFSPEIPYGPVESDRMVVESFTS